MGFYLDQYGVEGVKAAIKWVEYKCPFMRISDVPEALELEVEGYLNNCIRTWLTEPNCLHAVNLFAAAYIREIMVGRRTMDQGLNTEADMVIKNLAFHLKRVTTEMKEELANDERENN